MGFWSWLFGTQIEIKKYEEQQKRIKNLTKEQMKGRSPLHTQQLMQHKETNEITEKQIKEQKANLRPWKTVCYQKKKKCVVPTRNRFNSLSV
jgi:ribosomal protein L29